MTIQILRSTGHSAKLVAALVVGGTSAWAATFSTNSGLDAFVATGPTGNLANNNYGGAGSLSLSSPGLTQGEFQSVLQFDLSGAVASFNSQFGLGQWSLHSVSLQLTAAAANNPIFNTPTPGTFEMSWMQNDSWQEGSGSPSNPGATGITFNSLHEAFISPNDERLGTFSFDGATSGATPYRLGLTAGFLSDVASGGPVSLRLFAADDSASGVFNSRNFGTAANRPLLTLEAVPEPDTRTLVLLGLTLFASWRFVRHNDL